MNRDNVKRRDNSEIHLFLTLKGVLKWLKLRINVKFEALKQECPFYLAASELNIEIVIVESIWDLTYKFTGRA